MKICGSGSARITEGVEVAYRTIIVVLAEILKGVRENICGWNLDGFWRGPDKIDSFCVCGGVEFRQRHCVTLACRDKRQVGQRVDGQVGQDARSTMRGKD